MPKPSNDQHLINALVDVNNDNFDNVKFYLDLYLGDINKPLTGKKLTLSNLASGESIPTCVFSPLQWAVSNHNKNMVEYLLSRGVDLSTDHNKQAFMAAVEGGNLEIVEALLQKGADVDSKTFFVMTPLHIAVKKNDLEMVSTLLERGVDWSDYYNKQAFRAAVDMAAVEGGNFEIVNALLQKGVDVDSKTLSGMTPLHIAVKKNDLKMVSTLLEKGADLNVKTVSWYAPKTLSGMTPLHIAVEKNNLEMVNTLLEKGADLNIKTASGYAPIHLAANKGYFEIVNTLLEKGVDIKVNTDSGLSLCSLVERALCCDLSIMGSNGKLITLHEKLMQEGHISLLYAFAVQKQKLRDYYTKTSLYEFAVQKQKLHDYYTNKTSKRFKYDYKGLFLGLGFTAGEQEAASKALIDKFIWRKSEINLEQFKEVLNQGELGKIYKKLLACQEKLNNTDLVTFKFLL